MSIIGVLSVSLKANATRFVKGIRGATRAMLGLSVAQKKMSFSAKMAAAQFRNLARLVGVTAIVTGFIRLARSVEEFNRAMLQSMAIMGDLSVAMKDTMRQTAIDVARVTVFSAKEVARAYFFLASAGLSAKQSIAALPFVAKFAQAGMFDMALATDLLTDAQSALGLTVKDVTTNMRNMRRMADVLVKANTLANASVQQFSEALTTKAGASLKILNKDIEEGVAVLAVFADQGIKSSLAGTALSIVLRDLSTKAIKNANAFKRFNVEVFDAQGKMQNIADVVRDLEDALRGMSDMQKKATLLQLGFSDKSVIFIQTLIGMSERMREYEKELRKAGGTTEMVAGKQLTALQKGMAEFEATMIEVGASFTPVLAGLGALAKGFARLFDIMSHSPGADIFFGLLGRDVKGFTKKDFSNKSSFGEAVFESKAERQTMIEMAARFAKIQEDAANETEKLADALEDVNDQGGTFVDTFADQERALKSFEVATNSLRKTLSETGMSGLAIAEERLFQLFDESKGAVTVKQLNDALQIINDIRDAQDGIKIAKEATQASDAMAKRAQRVVLSVLTDAERVTMKIAELDDLLAGGLITWEVYGKAVDAATKALEGFNVASAIRPGEFREINLALTPVSGVTALGRNQTQNVTDSTGNRLLRSVDSTLKRNTFATVLGA